MSFAIYISALRTLDEALTMVEEKMILNALDLEDWNISKAAVRLGVTRTRLSMKMARYQMRLHPSYMLRIERWMAGEKKT